jgi:hypothetical protein
VLEGVILLLLFNRSCYENETISIRDLQVFHKNNAKEIKTLYKKISTQLRENAIKLIVEHIQLFDMLPEKSQNYILSICVNYFTQHQLREKSIEKSHIFQENISRIYHAMRFSANQNIQDLLANLMSMQGIYARGSVVSEACLNDPDFPAVSEAFLNDLDLSAVSEACLNNPDGPSIEEVFSDDEDDVSDVASDHTLTPNN